MVLMWVSRPETRIWGLETRNPKYRIFPKSLFAVTGIRSNGVGLRCIKTNSVWRGFGYRLQTPFQTPYETGRLQTAFETEKQQFAVPIDYFMALRGFSVILKVF